MNGLPKNTAAVGAPPLDFGRSAELAAESRLRIARLLANLERTKDHLMASQQRLDQSVRVLYESAAATAPAALVARIQGLAGTLEELHLRLNVELSTAADDLQSQLALADDLRSLAEFCALVREFAPA